MNDLDQLREFRAEIPYPERPRLSPGRSRLLAAARRPQRRRFTATRRTTLLLTAPPPPAAGAGAPSRVPPKTTPSPGQWIYSKLVQYQYPQGTSSSENWITFDGTESAYYESRGAPITVHTSPVAPPADITSDPLAAFNTDATPQTAYYALASLPTAPSQLLATVDRAVEAARGANAVAGGP